MIDETAAEIEDMQTHSSSVVAVKAARSLRELTSREFPTVDAYCKTLEQNSNVLRNANLSHASLHNTQREIVEHVIGSEPQTVREAKRETEQAIERVIDQVEQAKRRAAERAAGELEHGETIMTHDYSTTVLSAITRALEDGAEFTVYVTEARPRYLGRKMVRRLANMAGIDATLITDGACGEFLPEVDRVFLGMTCIVDDTLYNRVGTYPMAATAADLDVPVTVVGSSAKIVDGGFAFENDYRKASEVMREPADGFTVANPAYDATPTRLLDTVITDEGITELKE
jgi:translation initiation factor eIF-2B subunit delta